MNRGIGGIIFGFLNSLAGFPIRKQRSRAQGESTAMSVCFSNTECIATVLPLSWFELSFAYRLMSGQVIE